MQREHLQVQRPRSGPTQPGFSRRTHTARSSRPFSCPHSRPPGGVFFSLTWEQRKGQLSPGCRQGSPWTTGLGSRSQPDAPVARGSRIRDLPGTPHTWPPGVSGPAREGWALQRPFKVLPSLSTFFEHQQRADSTGPANRLRRGACTETESPETCAYSSSTRPFQEERPRAGKDW